MMKQRKILLSDLMPLAVLAVVLIVCSILTKGKVLSASNLLSLFDQAIPILIGASGMIFVISTGGVDMSTGPIMGLTSVVAAGAYFSLGETPFAAVVLVLIIFAIAAVVGTFTGMTVAYLKVSSFMVTLAMSIALRGLMAYAITFVGVHPVSGITVINKPVIKISICLICLALCFFLLEHHVFGWKCKAIGENETAVRNAGVNVEKTRVLAFVMSALMTAIATVVSLAKLGGSAQTFGSSFEMDTMFSIFVGGVLVTGGRSAKVLNFIAGTFTILVIENSLVLAKMASGEIKQLVEGLTLMVVLLIATKMHGKDQIIKFKKSIEKAEAESA